MRTGLSVTRGHGRKGEDMIRKLVATIAIVALFGALVGVVSVAVFTDTAANPTNQFTTGTVDISNSSEGSAIIVYSGMAPGDSVTQPLTVSNDGTLELRYAVTSLATNTDSKGLRAQLDLRIKSGVTTCTNAEFA